MPLFGSKKKAAAEAMSDDLNWEMRQAAIGGRTADMNGLLDRGAEVNSADRFSKYTALHSAAYYGHDGCVDSLVKRGANLNAQDDDKWTPLMLAALNCHPSTVQKLLAAGADPTLKNRDGRTALDEAKSLNHTECIRLLQNPAAAQTRGARLAAEAMSDDLNVQMWKAAGEGRTADMDGLLDRGAEVNSTNPYSGDTALHWAAYNGHDGCVDSLVKRGANVNAQSDYKSTPLMYAALEGHPSTVQKLLAAGADPTLKDKDGETALDEAKKYNHTECIRRLENPAAARAQVQAEAAAEKEAAEKAAKKEAAAKAAKEAKAKAELEAAEKAAAEKAAAEKAAAEKAAAEKARREEEERRRAAEAEAEQRRRREAEAAAAREKAVLEARERAEATKAAAMTAVQAAMAGSDAQQLQLALQRATEAGVGGSQLEAATFRLSELTAAAEAATNRAVATERAAARQEQLLEMLRAAAAPPLSRLDAGALRFAIAQARQNGVPASDVEAAELTLAAAEREAEKTAQVRAAMERAAIEQAEAEAAEQAAATQRDARRQLSLEQLQAAAAPALSRLNCDTLRLAIDQARQNDVEAADLEPAELKLRAATELESSLVAMLEQLSIEPTALVRANLLSVSAVAGAGDGLRTAIGPDAAAALQDAVRRTGVTPRELEVAFARLAIGERLGAGSFGTVHAVTLDGGGGRLALKRVSLAGLPPAQRDETLRAAKREVRALSRLIHLNVVRLLGVVVDEAGSVGMLLELAPRGSLRDLLDSSPAEVVGREAVQMELAANVVAAMAFLHAQTPPVLHHDLKSGNVLVFDGAVAGALQAKLTDFGLSLGSSGTSLSSQRTTRAGAGTLPYKAPEQFSRSFTEASEVYSFAIISWELLDGGRPWAGFDDAALMMAVIMQRDRPPFPPSLPDGVLRQLTEECWVHEPADRPTFAALETRMAVTRRTFAASSFRSRYEATAEVTMQHTLWAALHGLVSQEARQLGVPQARADAALLEVQRNAFTAGDDSGFQEALNPHELRKLTARVWSSAATFEGRDHWPCSLLQAAIRADDPEHAAVFARALCAFVVTRNRPGLSRPTLPPQTYRGGALPRSKHYFFTAGKQYRMPMFLSSTTNRQKAHEFMQELAPNGSVTSKEDAVLWTFVFDPSLGCNHINLIDRHDGTLGGDANQAAEDEWLFAPYSFFTVESVDYKDAPTWTDPHRVVLKVAPDNQLERADVPNAPWG